MNRRIGPLPSEQVWDQWPRRRSLAADARIGAAPHRGVRRRLLEAYARLRVGERVDRVEQALRLSGEILGLLLVDGVSTEGGIFEQANHLAGNGVALRIDARELILEVVVRRVIRRVAFDRLGRDAQGIEAELAHAGIQLLVRLREALQC